MKSRYSNVLKEIIYIQLFLCVLWIPFPFYLFSFQAKFSQLLFGSSISQILKGWGIYLKNPEITSDSLGLYVLVILLFMLTFLVRLILSFFKNWKVNSEGIILFIRTILVFYLSMQLLKYGFDKLFKAQFYLPEPNILYTPLGQISKDLLFWSTMGSSHSYNVFMGLLEIIPALFLMFRKTRIIGLLVSIPVLINIVAINFSYDISVKVYSIFLLSIALFLSYPYWKKIFLFFIKEKSVRLEKLKLSFHQSVFYRTTLKTLVIGLIFIEALFPYISTWCFNDDLKPRPYLHGAYEIQSILNEDRIVSNNELPIKRIFIHRRGYLIFQNGADEMQDFKLRIDTIKQQFILRNYQEKQSVLNYNYLEKEGLLSIDYVKDKLNYQLVFKELDWGKLPLMQNDFHWFVEEVDISAGIE